MQNKRRVQRTSVLKNAKIILRSGASVFDCTLLDLTNLGSCIALTSPGGFQMQLNSLSIRQFQAESAM